MEQKAQVSTAQQTAITAIRDFFLNEGDWSKVEAALTAAKVDCYIENPVVPSNSRNRYLDTIVRDSYWDLRRIGLDDETAYAAVVDC